MNVSAETFLRETGVDSADCDRTHAAVASTFGVSGLGGGIWAFHVVTGGGVRDSGTGGLLEFISTFLMARSARLLRICVAGEGKALGMLLCPARVGVPGIGLRICSDNHEVEGSAPNSRNSEMFATWKLLCRTSSSCWDTLTASRRSFKAQSLIACNHAKSLAASFGTLRSKVSTGALQNLSLQFESSIVILLPPSSSSRTTLNQMTFNLIVPSLRISH